MKFVFKALLQVGVLMLLGLCALNFSGGSNVFANDFGQTTVRLERTQVSQPSYPILIVIEPSTLTNSRTETSLRFTLGSGFTVSGTASNVTTSTTGLPATLSGNTLTAMPGLSASATSVSGQQMNFAISDLSDGNRYAFYITGGVTNPSTAKSYRYSLATRDGGGDIDTSIVGSEVDISNDRVTVSAQVPAKSSNGELAISGVPGNGGVLHDGDVLVGTITYGSTAITSKPFTIIASWDKGTVVNSSNLVELFDYVVGSASEAYGGTQPSVDVQARRITWNISSLPANTENQTVRFRLRVRSDIPKNTEMTARIHADGTIGTTSLSRESLTYSVRTRPETHPTPTVVPEAEEENLSGGFDFEHIRMQQIRNDSAVISVRATENAQVTVSYGLRPGNFDKTIRSLTYSRTTFIELPDLTADTQYYFRVTVRNEAGETRTSDILTFKTSLIAVELSILRSEIFWKQLLLSSSESDVVSAFGQENSENAFATPAFIPKKKNMTIKVHIGNPTDVREMYVKIVRKGVLGINTFEPLANQIETRMLESLSQQFIGELQAPAELGRYELIMTIYDVYGGLYTTTLTNDVFVMNPIMVVNRAHRDPVESAEVMLYQYSDPNNLYIPLDESITFGNTTDERGELDIALVKGKYKAEVSSIGYKPYTFEFTLDEDHPYPYIELDKNTSLSSLLQYTSTSLTQLRNFMTMQVVEVVASSYGRAALLILSMLLMLLLALVAYVTKYKFPKKLHKHLHHPQIIEHIILMAYILFILAILPNIFAFGLVSYYVGFLKAVMFVLIALIDLWLLHTYVRWMTDFIHID